MKRGNRDWGTPVISTSSMTEYKSAAELVEAALLRLFLAQRTQRRIVPLVRGRKGKKKEKVR
jgi:hypothetical protein